MAQTATSHGFELVIPPKIRRASRFRGKFLILGLVVVVLAAAIFVAFSPWRSAAPRFRSLPVAMRTITSLVEATGYLEVVTRTEVPAPTPGALVQALVQPGALVTQGQPLAQLDQRAADIALRTARASLSSAAGHEAEAQAALSAARDVRERTERLAERGFSSASELSTARSNEAQAKASLAAAQAEREVAAGNLAGAKLQDSLRTISAPTAGVVLVAPSTLGTMAAPDREPLFVLGSPLDSLRVDASVAESDIGQIRVGQHATFTVPAFPDQPFDAQVQSIGVDATRNGASVRYHVELRAPNPNLRLLPGMTATLHIEVGRSEAVLAVREAALRFTPPDAPEAPPRSRVWRLDADDQLSAVAVEAGLSDSAYTELRPKQPGALKLGDRVVIGQALSGAQATHGPGISLGGR